MKRYCISPIIGSGTSQDPYRASVSDPAGVNSSSVIPTHTSGPNLGKPKYLFAFCVTASVTLTPVSTISNVFVFPDYPLDGRMDGMDAATRLAMRQSVEAYNLDGNGLHFDVQDDDADSYRDMLSEIVHQIEPAINLNSFDCPEISE